MFSNPYVTRCCTHPEPHKQPVSITRLCATIILSKSLMDSAQLELVIRGGRDLKDVKHLGTMNPYAIVWIAGCGKESIKMTTPVAVDGGCFPQWNYSMKFHIVPVKREYSLFIQIKHDGMMFDRHIGEVEVRFADLLPPNASEGRACYQLTIPSGEEKGGIIVSHKFSELFVRDDGGTGISNLTDPRGKKKRDKAKRYAKNVAKFAVQFLLSDFDFDCDSD